MKEKGKLKKYLINGFIAVIAIVVIGFTYYEFSKEFTLFRDPVKIRDLILSFGHYSILAFIALQILQVVIFFIPGEVVQIAGGYIFGPIIGGLASSAGIIIGSIIGYFIAKILGKKYINGLIERNNLTKLKKILDAGSNNIAVFIIYFIPGIPKDILVYVAGISNVKLIDFIIYSSLGRLPWIIASAVFGHGINEGNYATTIAIAIISGALFLVGILKGHSIVEFFHDILNEKGRKTLKNKDNKR
ncbi:MAG: VTT domain-containing protein [Clostridium sp.]